MAEQVQAGAGPQFQEAIDFLKGKLPESSVRWDDLAGPVHSKVFTVAGATSADLARDLQGALVDALKRGTTISEFRKQFDQAVTRHGWSYNGTRGWRTQLIYSVNMRSAHMAGRWAQIQANKERRPFLQYRTAGDSRVRPLHRQWNGRIYPVDDAFWTTHYPPCGWNCRCTVRAYSQADLTEKGLQVSEPFEMKTRDVITREGEIVDRVPVGIDPGWDHNVGRSWISPELALGEKLARLPRELQGLLVDKTISPAFQEAITERWKAFRSSVEETGKPQGLAQVVGYLDSATLEGLAAAAPGLKLDSTVVGVFDKTASRLASSESAIKGWPPQWLDRLPEEFRNYQAVLWDSEARALVVVPQGTLRKGLPTITLRPNQLTKLGKALVVEDLGAAPAADLDGPRYVVLAGKVR